MGVDQFSFILPGSTNAVVARTAAIHALVPLDAHPSRPPVGRFGPSCVRVIHSAPRLENRKNAAETAALGRKVQVAEAAVFPTSCDHRVTLHIRRSFVFWCLH